MLIDLRSSISTTLRIRSGSKRLVSKVFTTSLKLIAPLDSFCVDPVVNLIYSGYITHKLLDQMCDTLSLSVMYAALLITNYAIIQRAGYPQKYHCENVGFVTFLKFTYPENKFIHS